MLDEQRGYDDEPLDEEFESDTYEEEIFMPYVSKASENKRKIEETKEIDWID
ncbi:MAG: hypothetical protein RR914_02215 [Oscillospiraceae bacterium]